MENQITTSAVTDIAAWLIQRKPQDVDRALQSQASRLGVGLTVRFDGAVPYRCEAHGSVSQLEVLRAMIGKAMQPASDRDIEAWLAELSVIVPRRKEDEFTDSLRLVAYAARLRDYPADVVKQAVTGHIWTFWPSWAELDEVCARLVAPRRVMLAAKVAGPQPEPDREKISAERAAEIMAEAGFTPKRMEALRKAPMASTFAEAEARRDSPPAPHWTETASEAEMEQLRAARDANPIIAEARRAQAKARKSLDEDAA